MSALCSLCDTHKLPPETIHTTFFLNCKIQFIVSEICLSNLTEYCYTISHALYVEYDTTNQKRVKQAIEKHLWRESECIYPR